MKSQPSLNSSGKAIVIIPARGGSKRFPRKNIAMLAGKPLIYYSITAALESTYIDSVYVSTEDDEIAQTAIDCGAQVPFLRPVEMAGDNIPADIAVSDHVRRLQSEYDMDIDIIVLIQPTSPFVTSEHIDAAVKLLRRDSELESVTTMAELDHRHHPYNLSFKGEDDRWNFIFEEERKVAKARQEKPIAMKFGNLFAARTKTMLEKGRFGDIKGAIMIDSIYSWDIDHEWELDIAENLIDTGKVNLPHIKT